MKSILLLLGSPNDNRGNLSQIAIDRVNCAYGVYKSNVSVKLLCTGGFGEQFNTTGIPHAHYAKKRLVEMGADPDNFLPFVLSSNTYEDFDKAKVTIEEYLPDILIVITSDFHMERARLLQKKILDYPGVIFIPAKSSLPENELLPFINHEKKAIEKIEK